MSTKSLTEGLAILAKYNGGEAEEVAEHDAIHAGPSLNISNPITEEDEDRLRALGWVIGDADRWMYRP